MLRLGADSVIKQGSLPFVDKVLAALGNLITVLAVTYSFTPDEYSVYIQALILAGFLQIIFCGGHEAFFQQYYVEDCREIASSALKRSILQKTISSSIIIILCVGLATTIKTDFWWYLALLTFTLLSTINLAFELYFIALKKYKLYFVVKFPLIIACILIKSVAAYWGDSLFLLGCAVAFESVFVVGIITLYFRSHFIEAHAMPMSQLQLKSVASLTAVTVLQFAVRRADIVCMGLVGSSASLAIYSLATRITEPVILAANVVGNVLYKRLQTAYESRDEQVIIRLYRKAVFFGFFAVFLVNLISFFMFSFIFEKAYASGQYFVFGISFGLPFLFLHATSWRFDLEKNLNKLQILKLCYAHIVTWPVLILVFIYLPIEFYGVMFMALSFLTYIGFNALFPDTRENFIYQIRSLSYVFFQK